MVAASLNEEQIFTGEMAVTQACCQSVLQSSTEQWGMHVALSSAGMQYWWVTAYLHEQQIFMSVFAVTQACCQLVSQSSIEQWFLHFALSSDALQ